MKARILSAVLALHAGVAGAQQDPAAAMKAVTNTYLGWRQAVIDRNPNQWRRLTASHRQMEVRNRLLSEKKPFPASVFQLPAPPPSLAGLRSIHFSQKGATAKAAFFGKVDFGVGGRPEDNILVLSFVSEGGQWKYSGADYVNLVALPDVRKELAKGDLSYVRETPEFQATGVVPRTPIAAPPAKYISKVYAFCPGREVNVQINQISRHRFANAKEAEIIVGGAKDGRNVITYNVKPLEGGTGKEAMTIRVYLMSEVAGTKPIKIYEYQVKEGGQVEGFGRGVFNVDEETAKKLIGK